MSESVGLPYMDAFIALILSILSGVIVSLVTLWFAGRQHARQETRADARRREAILSAIGRELQWNRIATRTTLDASNAHYMIGRLSTVAFERHGSDLTIIAPDSVELVFKPYSTVGMVREGIRVFAGPPDSDAEKELRLQWIELSDQARPEVSNSATEALKRLGLPLASRDSID